jgi:VIT1/CCC1 family predicted Fe2+/Mn2+ transporter
MLAAADQPEMRRLFREYLDARLQVYQKLPNLAAAEQEMEHAAGIQQRLWSQAVTASRAGTTPAVAMLLLPAINQMIDVTTSRKVALYTHLPSLILVMLMIVALFSGLLAGYAMAKRSSRSWLHMLVYALVVAVTIYAVIDLDYPRSGLIRLDAADNALAKLRDSIR